MQLNDHINRFVDNGLEEDVASPMDPPESFAATTVKKVPYEEMADVLRALMDQHKYYLDVITRFDEALVAFKKNGWQFDEAISRAFKEFFLFSDYHLVPHHQNEEKVLFPLLRERLMASGEHSPGTDPITPIDLMEDDHIKIGQTSCLIFSLLGLGSRLPDPRSRDIIFENAFLQGQDLAERLKLHIYKEDEVVFPLAQQHIRPGEFEAMKARFHQMHDGPCRTE